MMPITASAVPNSPHEVPMFMAFIILLTFSMIHRIADPFILFVKSLIFIKLLFSLGIASMLSRCLASFWGLIATDHAPASTPVPLEAMFVPCAQRRFETT